MLEGVISIGSTPNLIYEPIQDISFYPTFVEIMMDPLSPNIETSKSGNLENASIHREIKVILVISSVGSTQLEIQYRANDGLKYKAKILRVSDDTTKISRDSRLSRYILRKYLIYILYINLSPHLAVKIRK